MRPSSFQQVIGIQEEHPFRRSMLPTGISGSTQSKILGMRHHLSVCGVFGLPIGEDLGRLIRGGVIDGNGPYSNREAIQGFSQVSGRLITGYYNRDVH
jgi:hypothetical protein